MGEPLDMFGQPVGKKFFHHLDDPSVKASSPVLQQTPVGYLMRESVLEGVDRSGRDDGNHISHSRNTVY